jgi:hypothetical protein
MARRPLWNASRLGAPLALVALALVVGCGPPVPAEPAYDTDVRPIFMAHCIRCHGAGPDGGTINTATQPTGPDGGPLASDSAPTTPYYFNVYTAPGKSGALSAATNGTKSTLHARIHGGGLPPMPPAPAPRLDDWELKVLDAWVVNPICSRSPNPDPTICPPDLDAGP